ncbi:hypothetical protein YC2023_007122 [Brassica napus]
MFLEKRRKETLQSLQAHRIVATYHLRLFKMVPHRIINNYWKMIWESLVLIIFFSLPFISIADDKTIICNYHLSFPNFHHFLHKMGMFHDKNPNKKKSLMSLST